MSEPLREHGSAALAPERGVIGCPLPRHRQNPGHRFATLGPRGTRDCKQRVKTAEELRGRPTQKGQRRSRSRSRSRARRPRWFEEEDSDQGQGGSGSGHKSRSQSRNRSRHQSRGAIKDESYPPLAKQTGGPGQRQGQQQQLQKKSSGVKDTTDQSMDL
nr:uncharacterized protein LOC126539644 [Dermacentor andersoni]